MMDDNAIRLAAFDWLKIQSEIYLDGIPREKLAQGFEYHGERITLVGPQGIWKPKVMTLPLSVTTIENSAYDDGMLNERLLKYSYRGENPNHVNNVGLRTIMQKQIPLIYFLCIHKGYYIAEWPVYIVKDDIPGLSFTIDIQEKGINKFEDTTLISELGSSTLEKAYRESKIMVRLHQKTFRERVLLAYASRCSLCKLKHRELLDAAHIIGDREGNGEPIVQNGISLCKIHHAAFDANIIGISPTYMVQVRKDILKETDGPMLRFGIQELNGTSIILPERRDLYPDKVRLEERFERFLRA